MYLRMECLYIYIYSVRVCVNCLLVNWLLLEGSGLCAGIQSVSSWDLMVQLRHWFYDNVLTAIMQLLDGIDRVVD